MKRPIFTGSATAIITPFFDGTVHLPTLKKFIEYQIAHGADAIVVCGTTGEASTMSYGERMRTISACVEQVNGRVPVIAGTGSNSTENAIALSKDAERAGADGLLVVTPYYNKTTQEGLVRHYHLLADSVSSPVIVYHVPSRTGVTITPETYLRLSVHPNIIGTKEASGNLSSIQKTRVICPNDFYIWSGNDDDTAAICMLGGVGVISVVGNIMPAEMHQLVKLCTENDFRAAGALQLRLKPVYDAIFCEVNPIPVKAALQMLGWNVGGVRLPLCPPSAEHLEMIRKTLIDYGLLEQGE